MYRDGMTPHYRSLDDLIAAAPASGPLGGPGVNTGRRTYAFLDTLGRNWIVTEETHVERLVELRDFIAAGGDPVRITEGGTRALGTGGNPDRLYIYEYAGGVAGRPATRPRTHAVCCNMEAPIGSECSECGEVVAGPCSGPC